jgi:hypothetical protein
MPQDSSPLCHAVISISSSVGSSLSSLIHATWSEHMGAQVIEGVTSQLRTGWGSASPVGCPARPNLDLSHGHAPAVWCRPLRCTSRLGRHDPKEV